MASPDFRKGMSRKIVASYDPRPPAGRPARRWWRQSARTLAAAILRKDLPIRLDWFEMERGLPPGVGPGFARGSAGVLARKAGRENERYRAARRQAPP